MTLVEQYTVSHCDMVAKKSKVCESKNSSETETIYQLKESNDASTSKAINRVKIKNYTPFTGRISEDQLTIKNLEE